MFGSISNQQVKIHQITLMYYFLTLALFSIFFIFLDFNCISLLLLLYLTCYIVTIFKFVQKFKFAFLKNEEN